MGQEFEDFLEKSTEVVEQASGMAADASAFLMLPLQFSRAGSPQAVALDFGFSLYVLLKYLLAFQEDFAYSEDWGGQSDEIGKNVLEAMHKPALEFYSRFVGSVEIVNAEGELERVFFRFPYYCRSLPPERRHRLVWTELDRETPGAQLQGFIEAADDLQFQMKYAEWLSHNRLWSLLMNHKRKAFNSMFGLALVVNLSLIVRSGLCIDNEGSPFAWSDQFCSKGAREAVIRWEEQQRGGILNVTALDSPSGYFSVSSEGHATDGERAFAIALQVVVFVLGKFMALSSMMIFVLNAAEHGVPRIRRRWLRRTGNRQAWSETLQRVRCISPSWDEFRFKLFFYPLVTLDFLWDARLVYYGLSFWCCAVMASLVSPYFLCVGLLDLYRMDQSLQGVATALGSNAEPVIMTFLFMLVIIYMYAIVAYLVLAESFGLANGHMPVCTSLWQCLIAAADNSLRENDIGAISVGYTSPDLATGWWGDQSPRGNETLKYYFQHLFAFTFWLIIVIIMLNAVFGIMIDSFGEVRAKRKEIKRKNETECFICGIDRFMLDTKGGGFERHIEEDHNMWSYLFLIATIRGKEETQYNGWEQHVAMHLAAKDTSFLPRDALSLQNVNRSELAEEQAERARAAQMAASVAELTAAMNTMQNEQKSVKQAILALQETLAKAQDGSTSPQLGLGGRAPAPAQADSTIPQPYAGGGGGAQAQAEDQPQVQANAEPRFFMV